MEFSAAVLSSPGADLAIERIHVHELGPTDVLVRIEAAGLCHTDWEAKQRSFAAPTPIVLGHEGAGIVEEIGRGVTAVRPGDHVVCSPFPICGHCFYCQRGQPMLCEPVTQGHACARLPDGRDRLFRVDGQPVGQFLAISSFAEYAVVPEAGAVRVPPEMPLNVACILGCAAITGVGGALRIAGVTAGESVFVVGCGPVGLNAIQGARLGGAAVIVASDIDPRRLALARELGATHGFDPREVSVAEEVRRLTAGRGADHAFETAGQEATLLAALDASRPGGTITILGKMEPSRRIGIRFGSLMGDRRIRRSSLGGGEAHEDFPMMARAYLEGRLKLDELVTDCISLDGISQGLDRVGRGETIRTILKPWMGRTGH